MGGKMQSLKKGLIVVAVLVVSIGAFLANVAYAAPVKDWQHDFTGSSPNISFTLPESALISSVSVGGSFSSAVALTALPRIVITVTSGGNTANYNVLPTESSGNQYNGLWQVSPVFIPPIDAGTAVILNLDGTIAAGTSFNVAVTGKMGTLTQIYEAYLDDLDWGVAKNNILSAFQQSATGSSPNTSFTVSETALITGLDVACDTQSAFQFPTIQVSQTFNGQPNTLTLPPIQYSPYSAVWEARPGFNIPIDANSTVNIVPSASIPTGTFCSLAAPLVLGTMPQIQVFVVERLGGGKNFAGLTSFAQSFTGSAAAATVTLPPNTYAVVTGVNIGCDQPSADPAPIALVTVTPVGGVPSNFSLLPNQSSSNPYSFTYSRQFPGPIGLPTNNSVIIAPAGATPAGTSCDIEFEALIGPLNDVQKFWSQLEALSYPSGVTQGYTNY